MSGHLRDEARKLRVGRKVGRTLYLQLGDEPSDNDPLVGVMDTRELAEWVVTSLAHEEAERERAERLRDVVDAAEILVVMIEEPAARGLMGEDWPAYYHGASLAVREKLDALAALSAREHGKEQS